MVQKVNVPGIGILNFPDNMSQDDMREAILSNFPELNQQSQQQKIPTDRIPEPEESSGIFRRVIADPAVSLTQGIIGLKEAAVGIADIPTMGYAGKGVEAAEEAIFGGTTADLKEKLQQYKSDELKAAEEKVAEAEGFVGTGKELLKNPSALVSTVVESVPSIYGGGKVAQYALGKASKYMNAKNLPFTPDYVKAGALGEGVVAAGAGAESIRQATESGTLSPTQAALATISGGLTGAFGAFGGRVAQELNLVDTDTLLAGGATQATKINILKNAIGSAISEGAFEELPQSFQEQILQNIALDKDPMEGVAEAAATGLLSGAAMGGGASLLTQAARNRQAALEENTQNASTEEEIKQQKPKTKITKKDKASDDILGAVEQTVIKQEITDDVSNTTEPIPESQYTPTGDSITVLGQPIRISTEGVGGPYGAGLAGTPINVGQYTTGKRGKPTPLNQSVQTDKINKSKQDIEETDADEALNYQIESERRGSVYTNLSQSNPNFQNLHPFVITGGINAAHSPLEYTSIDKSTKVKEGKFKRLGVNEIPITTSVKTVDSPTEATINAIDQAAYEDAILESDTFDTSGYNDELNELKNQEEKLLEEEYQGLLDEGYTAEEIRKNNPDTFGLRQKRGKKVTYYTKKQFEKVLGQEANLIRQKYENKKQPKLSDAEIDNKEIRDDFIKNLNDLQREMYSRRLRQYRQDIEGITTIKQPPGGKQEEVDYVFKRTPIENTGYERVPVMRKKGNKLVPLVRLRVNQETGDVREVPLTRVQKIVKEKGEKIQKVPVVKSEITETKEPSKAYIGPDLSVVYDEQAKQEITNLITNELANGPVSLNRILDVIANRKGEFKDFAFERMADHLSNFIKSTNNNVQIQLGTIESGNPGQFDPVNNIVTIDLNNMGPINPGQVVVHETMHAALDHIIDQPKKNRTADQNDGIDQLRELKKQVDKLLPQFKTDNLNEFIAEVYSNQDMQRSMGETKSTVTGRVVDLIQKFVEALTKALGFMANRDTFRGSLLQEATLEIESLLRGKGYVAPIEEFRGSKTRFAKKAPIKNTKTVAQAFQNAKNKVNTKEYKKQTPGTVVNKALSRKQKTARYLKTKFQNSRQPLKTLEEQLRLSGKLIIGEEGFNNINSLLELALGESDFRYKEYLAEHVNNLKMAIHNYAKAANLDMADALDTAHKYLQAVHEQERRMVKYIKNVPLNKQDKVINYQGNLVTPARFREIILDKLTTDENITPELARKYRKKLDEIVKKYKNGTPGMSESPRNFSGPEALNPDSDLYDVMVVDPDSSSQSKSAKDFVNLLKRDPFEKHIRAIGYMLKPIQNATQALNKEGNYLPKVAENIINFYGWDNYIPLKGKPGQSNKEDDDLDFTGERLGGDFRQVESTFEGRESESNNAIIQTMVDAVTSTARAGRRDVTQAISNLVKQNPSIGKIVETVTFNQKYNAKVKDKLLQGADKIVNYKPNGDLEIIQIKDEALLRSIRRTYQDSHWTTEALNNLTSLLGQTHTRYNPAFPLLNFVRDTLTNAFVLAAEKPSTLFRYTGNIAQQIAAGGMYKTNKMIRMFVNNDIEGMRAYAKKQGKGSFAADMLDYLEQGGAVSYIQALSIGTQLDALYKDALGPQKILLTKKDMDAFFDKWVNTFEISARVAAFRAVKADNMAKGMNEKQAVLDATRYAKGLANFEQVGEWGRGMGAWFMFFRPSATGAVRALDAITPFLQSIPGMGGMEEAINNLPKEIQDNPQAVEQFKQNYRKQRTSAMITVAATMGVGYMTYMMAYMMSGDDDEERNKIATDDPERWTRFARFDIGEDKVLQIPWGFGLGGFAAIGAQMAALSMSEYADPKNIIGNMANITLDSFLPLPVSRMNIAENTGMYMIDSITPSALRPIIEFQMNMNSFGYAIYNNRQTRYGNAYTGGDNIPQMYKDAAQFINEITNGELDMSPNSLYFFANNYFDGWSRMLHSTRELDLAISGRGPRDIDSLTRATMMLDSFVAKRSNVDAREFSELEKDILKKERKLAQYKESDPSRYLDYINENPMDQLIVDSYNDVKNKELNKLRAEKNSIRRNPGYTPAEKKEKLEEIAFWENAAKRKIMFMTNSLLDEGTEY